MMRILLLLALLFAGSALAADKRSPLVVVSTAESRSVIRQVPLSGTVEAIRDADLSMAVSGIVDTVSVDAGDVVTAGTVLVELDSEIARHSLEQLRAATRQASANLKDARRRYSDGKRLRKQNSISENELRIIETEVNADNAEYQQRLAEEKLQQATVERHTLKAPFDGVITERLVDTGEWIQPGDKVLGLVETKRLRVSFRVPQEFYPAIDDDTSLSITLDALPNKKLNASIDAVVPFSDSNSRTFILHAGIDAANFRITPGMSVHGKLDLATGSEGVVLSRDAIVRYPDGRITVWVIEPGSEPPTVTEKHVVLGKGFDGLLPIRRGIEAGDTVVVKGNESLKEGQEVRIHEK